MAKKRDNTPRGEGHCRGCNRHFLFLDYHWPHCKGNPKRGTAAATRHLRQEA